MKINQITESDETLNELSLEKLGQYKKAAGADARRADIEGDFERGNKRFSGIVKATKKEFEKFAPKKDDKKSQDVEESNAFTDARMNAIKADQKTFKVGGKTYAVTGDTSDELAAVKKEKESVAEGISLDSIAAIGSFIPNFVQRAFKAGKIEAQDSAEFAKILGKWLGTGQLSPAESKFAKEQFVDILKGIAASALAYAAVAPLASAHAATGVASVIDHVVQHTAADITFEALAALLAKKLGFNLPKQILHGLTTSGGKAAEKEHEPSSDNPELDQFVKKEFEKARTGFGGMTEQSVAEVKDTLWRVHQSAIPGRYYVVKGYDKDMKIFQNKMGAGDFRSKEDAQKKVDELNQGVAENRLNEIFKMPPTNNSSQGMTVWAYNDSLEKKSPVVYKNNNVIIFKANEDLLRYIVIQDGNPVLYIGLSKFLDGYKSGTVATEMAGRGKGLAQQAYLNASDILGVPIYSDSTQTDASRLGIWNKLIQQYPDRIVGYDQKTNKNLPLSITDKGPTVNQNQPIYVDRNKKDSSKPLAPNQRYRTRILKLLPSKKQDVAEGQEMQTWAALKDWQVYNVIVLNNFYTGKYPNYSSRHYAVVASSPEEARQVVLDNPDYVLKDLLSRKLQNGKRVLPLKSALSIEAKRVGDATPGKLTTVGFKTMLTPDGPKSMKFEAGKIIDMDDLSRNEARVSKNDLTEHGDKWERDQYGNEIGWGFKEWDRESREYGDTSLQAKRDKEQNERLKLVPPKLRKILGLPDPKEDI